MHSTEEFQAGIAGQASLYASRWERAPLSRDYEEGNCPTDLQLLVKEHLL